MAKKYLKEMTEEEIRDLVSNCDGFRNYLWRDAIEMVNDCHISELMPERNRQRAMDWSMGYSGCDFRFLATNCPEYADLCIEYIEDFQSEREIFSPEKFERLPEIKEKLGDYFYNYDISDDDNVKLENEIDDFFRELARELCDYCMAEYEYYDDLDNLVDYAIYNLDGCPGMYVEDDDPYTVMEEVIRKVC